jgi:hypothetical protein
MEAELDARVEATSLLPVKDSWSAFSGMGGPPRLLPVALGVLVALLVACASVFEGLVQTEQDADVRAPKRIVRERFRLEYPGNWTVDEEDEDYDPDHLFSIDSPGSCHVTFIVFDAVISAKTSVATQVEGLVPKIMREPVQVPFARWGAYDGEGVALAGRMLGLERGSIRIFAHESEPEDLTLTIVEFCFDEDLLLVRPGFELIERSFELGRPTP